MKYVFFGSPKFAAYVLKELLEAGFAPLAVVVNPDRPTGRKKILTEPEVKRIAKNQGNIEILQPEKLDADFIKTLGEFNADFFVVAAYTKIIPKEILAIPPKGVIGVHPSLLPKYRGASPIQSALLNSEKETGVTLYLMDEKVDHGPIIANSKWQLANSDDYETLEKKLATFGGDLLIQTLPRFMNGDVVPEPQDENTAKFTKKFTTEDGFIPLLEVQRALSGKNKDVAHMIFNTIKALGAEPGVWTRLVNGKRVKLIVGRLEEEKLILTRIQTEGKTPTSDESLINIIFS